MTTPSNEQNLKRTLSQEFISKRMKLAQRRIERGYFLKPGTYQRYIDDLRTKATVGATEKHHILPKHMKGGNEPSNIIQIGVRDHILAHLLLYLEQGATGNLFAYIIRQGTQQIALKSRSQQMNLMNKMLKKGWYDSKVQSELGKVGGKIGGSMNSKNQWAARSQVGQVYGRVTGLRNQSDLLKDRLETTLLFQHKDAQNEVISVANQESVIDIARYINQECENRGLGPLKLNLEKIKKGGPFYGLVKNTKKTAYGWTILKEIRLEEFDD